MGLSLGKLAAAAEPVPPKHPASFPDYMGPVLRKWAPPGRVLDPFGGVGRLGLLLQQPTWEVTSLEIEPEWAMQGLDNGCLEVVIGDATKLPFADNSWPCVVTSPPYGNRFADQYVPAEAKPSDKVRRSYRLYLGRTLHEHNAGGKHFGKGYEPLCLQALSEIFRVLQPGGLFICNCKDFPRTEKGNTTVVGVVAFWQAACGSEGFEIVGGEVVGAKGDQNTARHRQQGKPTVDFENILVYRKPAKRPGLRLPRLL